MIESLSQEERNDLLSLVTEGQRDFLLNQLKRGQETIFGNFMLSEKVHAIKSADDIELQEDEQDVVDWRIVEYVDHGLGNRHGKCACGRSLRFEFTVQHTQTKKTITYGKDHLADFLNLNVRDIDDVVYGLNTIDYELDELLLKIKADDYGYELLEGLPDNIDLPKDIKEHVEFHIPLLDHQIRRLSKIIQDIEREEERSRRKEQDQERKVQFKVYQKTKQQIMERFEKEEKEKQSREQEIIAAVNAQLPPNATLGEMAFSFVKNGISSATEISYILRNNYNVDKRISIGVLERPYIHMNVVLSLMEYVQLDYLIFDEESSGIEDCIFLLNPKRQLDNNYYREEIQETLF